MEKMGFPKIKINEEQKTFFDEEGYLIIDNVIQESVLNNVISDLEKTIDIRINQLKEQNKISNTFENESFETRLVKISEVTPEVALSMWNGLLHSQHIYELITNSSVIDVAESFCGPEVIASSVYRIRPKVPNFGYGEVPWHQDSGYFEPYCDSSLVLTMWIPLVDTNSDNGCMYVIPKTHKGAVVDHQMHNSGNYLEITEDTFPKTGAVCCPVKKGSMLLLHNKVMHASFKNTTNRVRWSMDLRYQSANLPTNANITKLPNEDQHNEKAGAPSACYPPEADFLVRSKLRPNEVIKSVDEFIELRENPTGKAVTNRFNVTWKEMTIEDIDI